MTDVILVGRAEKLKEEGNALFQSSKTRQRAIELYTQALLILEEEAGDTFVKSDQRLLDIRARLIGVIRSNIAQAFIRQSKWADALEQALKGTRVDPLNPKLWYRLAISAEKMSEFALVYEALNYMESTLKNDPVIIDCSKELKGMRERVKDAEIDLQDKEDTRLLEMKKRDFDEVIKKHNLMDDKTAGKLADVITSAGEISCAGDLIQKLSTDFNIPVEDAEKLMQWICVGVTFKNQSDRATENYKKENQGKK